MQKPVIFRLSTMIVLLLLAGFGTFYVLAAAGPVATGSDLFAIQGLAEQSWLGLQTRPAARSSYALDLLDRRTRDLAQSIGQGTEFNNLIEADRILNQAMVEVANLDSGERQPASARLLEQVNRLLQVTGSLQMITLQDPRAVANFNAKLTALRNSLLAGQPSTGELIALSHWRLDSSLPDARPAPAGFQHPFALLGKHAEINCQKCHNTSVAPDARVCTSCHVNQPRPANHPAYLVDCAACHTPSDWKGANFNHAPASTTQCATCHESRRPAKHFSGECASCHTNPGVTWKGAKSNHTGVTQCAACHESRRPANNHYKGDCAGCHTQPGVTWGGAKFNHSGMTQCASCHESRRPANHSQGECSACHTTPGVTWKGAKFNHAAANITNCSGCHAARRPANHFQAQCSTCHNTSGWKPASFKHTFPMNHNGANSQCATCHPSMTSAYTCFKCHNQAELTKEHAEKKIAFPADCMGCHPNGKE